MKVAFIVPYFGIFPNYFQLFLDSCEYNPNFTWIILTDNTDEYKYPPNVHYEKVAWNAFKEMVQARFEFQISLSQPKKLCDYKCAYGFVFENYIKGYDWWGYCDLDQIFGNLSLFITDEMLNKYDRIGSIGHLTLYRNTVENNRVFMNTSRYCEVFTNEYGCGFDEWLPNNVNDIYMKFSNNIYLQNCGADINSYMTTFQTVEYDTLRRCYQKSNIKNSIFLWDKGRLTQIFDKDGGVCYQEYPYVHLQKRHMRDSRINKSSTAYYIVPNNFVDVENNPKSLLKKSALYGIINYQFFKVKYNNLKYRLNSGDWKFSNIYKQKNLLHTNDKNSLSNT